MKKIYLALLALSLFGCPNNENKPTDAGAADACIDSEVSVDVIVCDDTVATPVSKDNWSLVLPPGWHEQVLFPHSQNVALLAVNEKDDGLFMLTKEPYTKSFDEFALETVRGLRDQNAEVLITSSSPLNGKQFVYVKSNQDSLVTDSWLTVQEGFGYSLNCGSLDNNYGVLSKDCQKIFSSFKVE